MCSSDLPETLIIGVEAADADAMYRSLQAGRRVRLDAVGLFADGAAVRQVGEETFRLCREHVDEMVLVDTDTICAAIKDVSRTPARFSSRPARWRSPAPRNGRGATRPKARRWWR